MSLNSLITHLWSVISVHLLCLCLFNTCRSNIHKVLSCSMLHYVDYKVVAMFCRRHNMATCRWGSWSSVSLVQLLAENSYLLQLRVNLNSKVARRKAETMS